MPRPIEPLRILTDLYASEINWGISTFAFCGYRAWLGDALNGFEAEGEFQNITDAIVFLAREAARRYPDSPFAAKYAELARGSTAVRASAHSGGFFSNLNKGPGSEPLSLDAPGVDIVADDLHGLDEIIERRKRKN
ncbi:hypothetical protein [Rhodoligotrophos defluvii]|uniref:hypothetical protein n=1 Tax=Rhodoligotrophos defluvii TaxID=2561934 RepID=UPI0010C9E4F1|nr:hypothetical protein [Rhodoligotrophos defluvii]